MTRPPAEPAPPVVAPTRDDEFLAGGSGLLGGPLGRRAGVSRSWWTPLRVVLLLAVLTVMGGYWQKEPCLTHAWTNDYQYTRMCYSDIYALYWSEGLDKQQTPYADHAVEYPVVIGGIMGGAAWIANSAASPASAPTWYFTVTAALLSLCALVVVVTTVQLSGRRPWDAAMVAVAPVLLLHAFTNWDLAAAALTGLAMVAWARRHPVWCGVFVGLGVATKLYPVLLLVALLPLCARVRQWRPWLVAVGSAAAAWFVVNAPVALLWHNSWLRFYSLNRTRPADWDSIWLQIQHYTDGATGGFGKALHDFVAPSGTPTGLNMLTLALAAILIGGVCILAYRVRRRPRVPQVLFLMVVAFLLVNKVWSPQYVIWYLALGVLALPRWRPFLLWQGTEAFLLFTRYYYFVHYGTGNKGIDIGWFFAGVLMRDASLLLIAGLVIRDMLRPEYDKVRAVGQDDPAGGVLDEAPDTERGWVAPRAGRDADPQAGGEWQPTYG